MVLHAADLTSVYKCQVCHVKCHAVSYVQTLMVENGLHTIPHGASRWRPGLCWKKVHHVRIQLLVASLKLMSRHVEQKIPLDKKTI